MIKKSRVTFTKSRSRLSLQIPPEVSSLLGHLLLEPVEVVPGRLEVGVMEEVGAPDHRDREHVDQALVLSLFVFSRNQLSSRSGRGDEVRLNK